MLKQITGTKSLLLLLLFFVFSCNKKDVLSDNLNQQTPVTRPVGQALEEASFETVGASGGTVQSPDGQIKIESPPGALVDDTEIGIQLINNTAASGIGHAYRLTPHGEIFQKKVKISFSYGNARRRISSSQALEVAYQNEKGIWVCMGGSANDDVSGTLSVETSHFSDWAFVASTELSPVVKVVGLSQSVDLKVLRYLFPPKENDLLIPLSLPEAGTGEGMLLERDYIVGWTMNGPGKLEANGNQATYIAPSVTSANKTATITVELNVRGRQVLLISTIHIIEDGIEISIDGGPWETYTGMATKVPELEKFTLSSLRTSADIPQIVFMWPMTGSQKADGKYGWSALGEEESNVIFEYSTPDLAKTFASFFEDENLDVRDSGGMIAVEETEENGKKFLVGSFAIDQAGVVDMATGEQTGISEIYGTFKVQRSW